MASHAALNKNARMRECEGAFFWLKDSGIANVCLNATDPTVGLAMSQGNATLKCYMGDTGLLVAQAFADRATTPSEVYRDILLDRLAINEGMLVENAVAQQLRASGHALFFFSRSSANKERRMEIDFLVAREYDDAAGRLRVSPIEVKSGGGRYATSSLDKFKRTFAKRIGTSCTECLATSHWQLMNCWISLTPGTETISVDERGVASLTDASENMEAIYRTLYTSLQDLEDERAYI